ncbi:flagellar basal body P-ring formation chaperone FlgA [Microbulbifer magnicolonia]|uniref:flagellar basal body P-ring formation chaperone FlgA n=1 Tax=Microbulbifer magnicolonia TaxID=3109744 RepID=UPI002B406B63|nr:flagellar basal body P-ring formation chaperone FlgA [Microbulbifer sp. GG15]
MKTLRKPLVALLLAAPALSAIAAADPAAEAVRKFLHQRSLGLGGEVQIEVHPTAAQMPRCEQPRPFLPGSGQKLRGRLTVGVRCGKEDRVRYLQARVSMIGNYWVSARPIAAGTPVDENMLRRARGDLGALPRGAVLEREQILGQVTIRPLGAGTVLQEHLLRPLPLVRLRQAVTLEARGRGFRIAREGVALENGALGERVRVRLPDRSLVSAVVSGTGRAQVHF